MDEAKREELLLEVDLVFRKINHFDDLRHRTFQVAIAVTTAAVAGAIALESLLFLFLASAIPLPFWYFEARYHSYQEGYTLRFWSIQSILHGTWTGELKIPDFYGNTHPNHQRATSLLRNLFRSRALMVLGMAVIVLAIAA